MSSSFPQLSVDEIILRHGSQDLYFMIIHNSVTLTAAKPGSHSIIYLDSITYWFYLYMISLTFSGTFSRKIPKRYSVSSVIPKQRSGNFRFKKKILQDIVWNSGFPEPFPKWKWIFFWIISVREP